MKLIKNYSEISNLLSKYYKANSVTNIFLKKEDFEELIENKCLYYFENECGLFLLKRRACDYLCYFTLINTTINKEIEKFFKMRKIPVLIELPQKKETKIILEAKNFFCNLGFINILERERYKLESLNTENIKFKNISFAKEIDLKQVSYILNYYYNVHTGCIPNDNMLLEDIKNNKIIIAKEEDKIIGLLHIEDSKNYSEIRHIVVLEYFRNKKIATSLVKYYHSFLESNKNAFVWVAKNNTTAIKLYEKNGYIKDTFYSSVFIKE